MKLKDLINEINFPKGHLQKMTLEQMSEKAIRASGMEDDMEGDDYELIDYTTLPVTDKKFKKALKNNMRSTGQESDRYKLVKTKGDGVYYMVDKEATVAAKVFVGVIKIDTLQDSAYVYDLKKGFELKAQQVGISMVAEELMGKGVGKLMYTLLFDLLQSKGEALASDSTLFEGSAGMWLRYMPQIADYFGIMIADVILPIPKEELTEANKKKLAAVSAGNGFVATNNPPMMLRKLANNLKGLSFVNGEYAVANWTQSNIKEKEFQVDGEDYSLAEVIDQELITDVKQLAKQTVRLYSTQETNPKNLRTLVMLFRDAVVVVKQLPDKLSLVVM